MTAQEEIKWINDKIARLLKTLSHIKLVLFCGMLSNHKYCERCVLKGKRLIKSAHSSKITRDLMEWADAIEKEVEYLSSRANYVAIEDYKKTGILATLGQSIDA